MNAVVPNPFFWDCGLDSLCCSGGVHLCPGRNCPAEYHDIDAHICMLGRMRAGSWSSHIFDTLVDGRDLRKLEMSGPKKLEIAVNLASGGFASCETHPTGSDRSRGHERGVELLLELLDEA